MRTRVPALILLLGLGLAIPAEGVSGGGGGRSPSGGQGSVGTTQGEPYPSDPSVTGLSRPVGWMVRKPDGTNAWYKYGTGNTQWTTLPGAGGSTPATLISVASVNTSGTKLSTVAASGLQAGTLAFVATVGDYFRLQTSSLTVDHVTVEAASGLAGSQWVRLLAPNLFWRSKTAYSVDPGNVAASDENDCLTDGTACKSVSEVARRIAGSFTTTTIRLLSDMVTTDKPVFSTVQQGFTTANIVGVPTVIYSSTLTDQSPTAPTPTTADNVILDAAVPGGSFTAAGAMAKGTIGKRTNGTVVYWFFLKDKGSLTARISQPFDPLNVSSYPAIAAGDSYQALRLPRVLNVAYVGPSALDNTFVAMPLQFQLVDVRFTISATGSFYYLDCYFSTAPAQGIRVGGFDNPCFDTGTSNLHGSGFLEGGAFKGSGATSYTLLGSPAFLNLTTRTFLQGAQLVMSSGAFLQVATSSGGIYSYDCTGIPIQATYWSFIFFFTGTIGGAGNTGALVSAVKWSQVAYAIGQTLAVAGSTSLANQLVVGGATHTLADLPIGVTYAGAAESGNGIYGAN